MRRYVLIFLMLGLLAAGLAACAKEGSATDVIQDYLKAKVSADADKMAKLSCNEWEAAVQKDATSFESVKAELKDLSCTENGKSGDYTLVSCTGQIVVNYDGENRALDVSGTTYRAIQEDDEWKMCGTE